MMVDLIDMHVIIIGWKRLRCFETSFIPACLYFPLWLMNELISGVLTINLGKLEIPVEN